MGFLEKNPLGFWQDAYLGKVYNVIFTFHSVVDIRITNFLGEKIDIQSNEVSRSTL